MRWEKLLAAMVQDFVTLKGTMWKYHPFLTSFHHAYRVPSNFAAVWCFYGSMLHRRCRAESSRSSLHC